MSVLSIRVLQNTQKVVICGRDSPNTQLSSIRPWTITAAYFIIDWFPVAGREVQHHPGDAPVHPGPRPQHPGRVPPVCRPEDVNINQQSDIELSSVQKY